MAYADVSLKPRSFGQTMRPDAWWVKPFLVFLGLGAFVVYSTWAAFQGVDYHYRSLLSPFYSPEIFGESPHRLLGPKPDWWPGWMPFSPALLILWVPGFFRLTCYYYRGAYYKSFWADPPACTVGEPRKKFLGEKSFPLIMQNAHRYFLYLGFVLLAFLAHDVWKAMWWVDPTTGENNFGLSTGTLLLGVNVVLLSGYTLGCHSLRHLVGGFLDQPSKAPLCQKSYQCVGCLNRRHMLWAWMSLCSVMFSDIYVRMCAKGIWTDWKFL